LTENAKKVAEAKMHRRLERQAAIEAAKQVKLRKGNDKKGTVMMCIYNCNMVQYGTVQYKALRDTDS
jgi:hypothetical protein